VPTAIVVEVLDVLKQRPACSSGQGSSSAADTISALIWLGQRKLRQHLARSTERGAELHRDMANSVRRTCLSSQASSS
jgi:hypothetical protein